MAEKETEITIYAKIGDFNGFTEAHSKEHHYQVEGKFSTGKKVRTRKTTKEDGTESFVLTIKIENSDNGHAASRVEHNINIDEEFFNAFKQCAEKAVKKTRYFFYSNNTVLKKQDNGEDQDIKLPDLIYQVDVYETTDGKQVDWCKIDIELDKLMEYMKANHSDIKNLKFNVSVEHLPFKPTESIVSTTEDDEQKARLNSIWDTFNQKPM